MGEPIKMTAENKPDITCHGRHQAAEWAAQGYKYADENTEAAAIPSDDLTLIPGVSEKMAAGLARLGLVTYDSVANAEIKELVKAQGIGVKLAPEIKKAAIEMLQ